MSKTLIILSHPRFAGSRANRALTEAAMQLPDVEIAHLEGLYPDGQIDVEREVARVFGADRIVLQFPMQWYATPPLLKAWQDAVLTRMFYIHPKTEGDLLAGRKLMVAVTAGNKPEAYSALGVNLFPLPDLLKPLEVMEHRCHTGTPDERSNQLWELRFDGRTGTYQLISRANGLAVGVGATANGTGLVAVDPSRADVITRWSFQAS